MCEFFKAWLCVYVWICYVWVCVCVDFVNFGRVYVWIF